MGKSNQTPAQHIERSRQNFKKITLEIFTDRQVYGQSYYGKCYKAYKCSQLLDFLVKQHYLTRMTSAYVTIEGLESEETIAGEELDFHKRKIFSGVVCKHVQRYELFSRFKTS